MKLSFDFKIFEKREKPFFERDYNKDDALNYAMKYFEQFEKDSKPTPADIITKAEVFLQYLTDGKPNAS